MDTLYIVTQMAMLVAICLNLFISISVWYIVRKKKATSKTFVLLEKEKEPRTRKRVIKG